MLDAYTKHIILINSTGLIKMGVPPDEAVKAALDMDAPLDFGRKLNLVKEGGSSAPATQAAGSSIGGGGSHGFGS